MFRRLVLFFVLLASSAATAQQKKPNVLFIVVDDLNTHFRVYGNTVVKTPHIKRLARRGVVFERAYCQLPWCNPSRTSLLSGRRPDTTRVLDNNTLPPTYLPGVRFLPQHFKASGYFAARVGKIYHEAPAMQDFPNDPASWDVSEAGAATVKMADRVVFTKQVDTRGTYKGLEWTAYDVRDEDTSDGQVARRIAALMEQSAKNDKPFFLAAGFRKPHLNWDASPHQTGARRCAAITRAFRLWTPRSVCCSTRWTG